VIRRHFLLVGSIVLAVVFFAGLYFCQPLRQVRRHNKKLIDAVESKDWKELSELMADDYSDHWGHDKATVIERSRTVFSQFFVIEVTAIEPEVEEADGFGKVRARMKLSGRGSPAAEMAIEKVAALQQPFVFEWRQASWKPWHWVLVHVDQPELEIPDF
jgi:hypothetical protein